MARLCIRLLFLLAGWGQSPVRTPRVVDMSVKCWTLGVCSHLECLLIVAIKRWLENKRKKKWTWRDIDDISQSACLSVTAGPLGFPEDPQCVPYLQGSDPVCPLHSTAHISGWQKIREETNPAKWIKMKITLAGIHPNSSTLNQGPVSHRPIEVRFFSVYFLFASKKREQGRTKKNRITSIKTGAASPGCWW